MWFLALKGESEDLHPYSEISICKVLAFPTYTHRITDLNTCSFLVPRAGKPSWRGVPMNMKGEHDKFWVLVEM